MLLTFGEMERKVDTIATSVGIGDADSSTFASTATTLYCVKQIC